MRNTAMKKYCLITLLVMCSCAAILLQHRGTARASEIDVDINYVYRNKGESEAKSLHNGATVNSGDSFKIIFTPKEDCYVYIYQIDSAGKIYSLFPMEEFGGERLNNVNPVQAGHTYHIPREDMSFELDNVTGDEKIYFVASRRPDTQLEEQYRQLFRMQQSGGVSAENLQQIDDLMAQLEEAIGTKGVSRLVADPKEQSQVTWQENDQTLSVLKQRLEGMCDGCVNILKFVHK